jgi:uncharacterized protein YodC (DUF2158 family)
MEDKVFFNAGDLVKIKHKINNRPDTMLVAKVKKLRSASGQNTSLSGIECIWFDNNGALHRETFNTKDLEKVYK